MDRKKTTQKKTTLTAESVNLLKKLATTQNTVKREPSVEFRFDAPTAKSVHVAGSFNGWDAQALKLKRDFYGVWRVAANLKPGRYQYRFLVDGKWTDDPKAKITEDNGLGSRNAILEVK